MSRPVDAFGLSDTGLVRDGNEDAFILVPDLGLFAVADGLGGHAAGERASQLAIEAVQAALLDPLIAPEWEGLAGAVWYANERVHLAARQDPALKGMGTTFTALLVEDGYATLAHVGDSRAYRLRGERLEQLTTDHTWVEAVVQRRLATREEAEASPYARTLARAVGGLEESVEVDTAQIAVEPGDTFLLCSDGLHGVVADEAIAAVLLLERNLRRAAGELVVRAYGAGAPDNVTAVLVRVPA